MAKNLFDYPEYWGVMQGYWDLENIGPPPNAGLMHVTGESGYPAVLVYMGPTVEDGDTIEFSARFTPFDDEEDRYWAGYVYVAGEGEYGDYEISSHLIANNGYAPAEVPISIPAPADLRYLGWPPSTGGAPWSGTFELLAAGDPPEPAVCFWTDLVNVTQEC